MGCNENNPNPGGAYGGGNQASLPNNSGNTPTNANGPYFKDIDTIPPGENREQFSFVTGANPQDVFVNPRSAPIEVCEVFFQSVGGNVVTLFANGVAITPAITLLNAQGYTDSGFILPQGQAVALLVTGAGTVGGFARWRY